MFMKKALVKKNKIIVGNKVVLLTLCFPDIPSVFAVLRRIKVTFLDTIVRIEHHPLDLETGVALEVHIKR